MSDSLSAGSVYFGRSVLLVVACVLISALSTVL
jgi:hypothetical protein